MPEANRRANSQGAFDNELSFKVLKREGRFVSAVWDSYGLAAEGAEGAIGIDLGLKDLMADSDGNKVEAQRFYRDLEPALATAQRAGKKDRVRAIHARIANRRRDHLHNLSTSLARRRREIFVGKRQCQGPDPNQPGQVGARCRMVGRAWPSSSGNLRPSGRRGCQPTVAAPAKS
jgi:hypothetical protein